MEILPGLIAPVFKEFTAQDSLISHVRVDDIKNWLADCRLKIGLLFACFAWCFCLLRLISQETESVLMVYFQMIFD